MPMYPHQTSDDYLVEDPAEIHALLGWVRRIAVLGIKTDEDTTQPAFFVPRYLVAAGFDVVPVPVYYPKVTEVLGRPVHRRLVDIPGEIDLVNVFRRAEHIPAHVDDILAKRPKAVWFQLHIRNDFVARRLAEAGIRVVQDRCLMSEHRHYLEQRARLAPREARAVAGLRRGGTAW